jgi:hypothetical protein
MHHQMKTVYRLQIVADWKLLADLRLIGRGFGYYRAFIFRYTPGV